MKKKIRTFLAVILLVVFGFVLGACGSTAIAEQTHPLKIWKENRNGQMETWKVVDENTGVNYIVVAPRYTETGNSFDGISITPRLNADGTLYTSK